ncbi:MAG: DUF1653 domain-containing protein [Clostridia bacterium]|nr:DUF1653 domain-containing protein [Clostridia bacterium]
MLLARSEVESVENLKINGVYKHYKGDLCIVLDVAYHSETCEKMVVYRALYGDNKLWVRPYNMFFDEVNKNGQRFRFELQDIKSVKE